MRQYHILVILLGLAAAVPALAQDRPAGTTGIAMSIDSMIRSIRDAYVDQFRTYAESRNDPAASTTCARPRDGPQPEIFEPKRQLYFDGSNPTSAR